LSFVDGSVIRDRMDRKDARINREVRKHMQGVKEVELVERKPDVPATTDGEATLFERLARDPLVDVDKLERLVQLHERTKARLAEERFNTAMSDAQQAMRPIAADAENPQTRSKYASYAAIDRMLRPIYTQHGFGVSFDTGDCPLPEHVRMLAYVTHTGGHARTYHADLPADGKGAKGGDVMTKTHATGAAMAYGMRYLLKMIWNVAVGEEDRDGNTPKEIPEPPVGFQQWWDGMNDLVPEGIERYRTEWKKSAQAYCDFVFAHLRDVHEARKTKAEWHDKQRAGAK